VRNNPSTATGGLPPLLSAIINAVGQHLNPPKPATPAPAGDVPKENTAALGNPISGNMPPVHAMSVAPPPAPAAHPAPAPTIAQQLAQNYSATGALLNSPYETMPDYKAPGPLGMSKGVKWGALALALSGLFSRGMTGAAASGLEGLEKGRESVQAKREADAKAAYEASAAKVAEANKVHQQRIQDLIAQSGVLEKQQAAAEAAAAKTAALEEKVREFNGRLKFDTSKFATGEADKIAMNAKRLDVAMQMRGMSDDTRMAVENMSVNAAQSRLAASLLNSSLIEASRSKDNTERIYGQMGLANTRAYVSRLQSLGSQADTISKAIGAAKDPAAVATLQAQLGGINGQINQTNSLLNSAMGQHADPKGNITYTPPSVDFSSVYAPPPVAAQPGAPGQTPVVVQVGAGGGGAPPATPSQTNLYVMMPNGALQPYDPNHPPTTAVPPAPVDPKHPEAKPTVHTPEAKHPATAVPAAGAPPPEVVQRTLVFLKSRQPWQQPQFFSSYPKELQAALIAAGYDPTGLGHGVGNP
jgi:hypothetical protein